MEGVPPIARQHRFDKGELFHGDSSPTGQLKTANFAVAGDTTQGVLSGLTNGEGQGFRPIAIMLMIGTNNSFTAPRRNRRRPARSCSRCGTIFRTRRSFSSPSSPAAYRGIPSRQDCRRQQDHRAVGRPAARVLHGLGAKFLDEGVFLPNTFSDLTTFIPWPRAMTSGAKLVH